MKEVRCTGAEVRVAKEAAGARGEAAGCARRRRPSLRTRRGPAPQTPPRTWACDPARSAARQAAGSARRRRTLALPPPAPARVVRAAGDADAHVCELLRRSETHTNHAFISKEHNRPQQPTAKSRSNGPHGCHHEVRGGAAAGGADLGEAGLSDEVHRVEPSRDEVLCSGRPGRDDRLGRHLGAEAGRAGAASERAVACRRVEQPGAPGRRALRRGERAWGVA